MSPRSAMHVAAAAAEEGCKELWLLSGMPADVLQLIAPRRAPSAAAMVPLRLTSLHSIMQGFLVRSREKGARRTNVGVPK